MTTEGKGGKSIDPKEMEIALGWNNPDILKLLEEGRYPVQRALSKIIGSVFKQYIPQGASIYEVGAGQGYLKDLVPILYHKDYVSSDYNIDNLRAGQLRRELTIERASATDLPLADNSKDCIVNMDAYDTLPDLQVAMNEAQRVLKPGGKFVHFQISYPSDDIVSHDYPDYVFFPGRIGEDMQRSTMMGIKREDIIKSTQSTIEPVRALIEKFLKDQREILVVSILPEPKKMSDFLNDILDSMPLDRIAVPSLPDYLRNKLETTSIRAGFEVVESGFRSTSIRGSRVEAQETMLDRNEFSLENGSMKRYMNAELKFSASTDIIEKATVLVFVAQKPQAN